MHIYAFISHLNSYFSTLSVLPFLVMFWSWFDTSWVLWGLGRSKSNSNTKHKCSCTCFMCTNSGCTDTVYYLTWFLITAFHSGSVSQSTICWAFGYQISFAMLIPVNILLGEHHSHQRSFSFLSNVIKLGSGWGMTVPYRILTLWLADISGLDHFH